MFSSSFIRHLPGFLDGMGSILDFTGNYYEKDINMDGLKSNALYDDWKAIGDDFREAIWSVEHDNKFLNK